MKGWIVWKRTFLGGLFTRIRVIKFNFLWIINIYEALAWMGSRFHQNLFYTNKYNINLTATKSIEKHVSWNNFFVNWLHKVNELKDKLFFFLSFINKERKTIYLSTHVSFDFEQRKIWWKAIRLIVLNDFLHQIARLFKELQITLDREPLDCSSGVSQCRLWTRCHCRTSPDRKFAETILMNFTTLVLHIQTVLKPLGIYLGVSR